MIETDISNALLFTTDMHDTGGRCMEVDAYTEKVDWYFVGILLTQLWG